MRPAPSSGSASCHFLSSREKNQRHPAPAGHAAPHRCLTWRGFSRHGNFERPWGHRLELVPCGADESVDSRPARQTSGFEGRFSKAGFSRGGVHQGASGGGSSGGGVQRRRAQRRRARTARRRAHAGGLGGGGLSRGGPSGGAGGGGSEWRQRRAHAGGLGGGGLSGGGPIGGAGGGPAWRLGRATSAPHRLGLQSGSRCLSDMTGGNCEVGSAWLMPWEHQLVAFTQQGHGSTESGSGSAATDTAA